MPFATALLSLLAAAGMSAAPPADTAAIRAAEAAIEAAQQRGDRDALNRLLAPDFLFVRASGVVGGRAEYVDGFAAPGHALATPRTSDPLLVRPDRDTAIVGAEVTLDGTIGGKPFRQHYRYAHVLARRDGRWVLVYAHVTGLPLG